MLQLKIHRTRINRSILQKAVAVLKSGGVVAYPTETAYGLAADPNNPDAVRRVHEIKGRHPDKQLTVIAGTASAVNMVVNITQKLAKLSKKHWPGPLTIVAPIRAGQKFPNPDGKKFSTLAVRIPGAAWPRAIAAAFGRPITATSANISGTPSLYSGRAVAQAFKHQSAKPDMILDGGFLPKRKPSTIVALVGGTVTVLRQGSILVNQKPKPKNQKSK